MQDSGLIQELPLSVPFFHNQVEAFLRESGLRMEEFDHYYACTSPDGAILAGAGIKADIIKCVAVAPSARSEGLMLPLLSRVVSDAAAKGILNLKVFTKPENREIFESIGFKVLASAPKAILMENGRGLEKYCEYLSGICHASGSEKLFFGTVPEKPIFLCQRQPGARRCRCIGIGRKGSNRGGGLCIGRGAVPLYIASVSSGGAGREGAASGTEYSR